MDLSLSIRISSTAPSDQPILMGSPSIEGSGAIGNLLTLNVGVWDRATEFDYQWLRDGVPIAGANGETYLVTAEDENHHISASVTAKNGAFSTVANASALFIATASAWAVDLATPGRFTINQSPNLTAFLQVDASPDLITISQS